MKEDITMNNLLIKFLTSATGSKSEGSGSGESTEGLKNALKNMIKSPIFYIVIGLIILLIITLYIYRRVVKPKPSSVIVIIRKGSIYRLIDEKSSKYFRVPFVDKIGAVISLKERVLTSDKLFINNGPDALYQINYTLKYKVTNPKGFYEFREDIQNIIINKINNDLREFADDGNALVLVKDYRENAEKILKLINNAIEKYSVSAIYFGVNLIKPLGR